MELSRRQKQWAAGLVAGAAAIGGGVVARKIMAARLVRQAAQDHLDGVKAARLAKAAGTRLRNKRNRAMQIGNDLSMATRGFFKNAAYKVPTGEMKGIRKVTRMFRDEAPPYNNRLQLAGTKGGRPKGTGRPFQKQRRPFGMPKE